jgi:hypothetical protein
MVLILPKFSNVFEFSDSTMTNQVTAIVAQGNYNWQKNPQLNHLNYFYYTIH